VTLIEYLTSVSLRIFDQTRTEARVLFYYGYKGGTGLIAKGELIKDTLKISTKGEFFYIRAGTNYKAGTTEVWLGNTIS
jgi:hypothetical protein